MTVTRRIKDGLSKSAEWTFCPLILWRVFLFTKNYQVVCALCISSQVNIFEFGFIPCSRTFHCSVCYSYWKNKLEQLISENSFLCCFFSDLLIKGLWEHTVILKLWKCLGIRSWQVNMTAYGSQENICNGNLVSQEKGMVQVSLSFSKERHLPSWVGTDLEDSCKPGTAVATRTSPSLSKRR